MAEKLRSNKLKKLFRNYLGGIKVFNGSGVNIGPMGKYGAIFTKFCITISSYTKLTFAKFHDSTDVFLSILIICDILYL